jgi:hypothetical protein
MPNGIYPVPKFRPYIDPSRSERPELQLRLKTWWRRDELDERLAHGAGPDSSDELRLRSRQLMSRGNRLELAGGFESAVRTARAPATRPTAQLSLRRAEVRNSADDLLVLAQRLRDSKPIDVRGAAMASRLLMNANSPLYREAPGFWELKHEVRSARLALDPTGLETAAMASAA